MAVVAWRCDGREQDVPWRSVANILDTRPIVGSLDTVSAVAAERVRDAVERRPADPSGTESHELRRMVRTLLETRAEDGMVLLLDDVHWADPQSAELFEFLVRKPVEAPLLLVLAHRTRQTSPDLAAALAQGWVDGVVERVELGPLSVAEAARMLDKPVEDPEVGRLLEEAECNPLYLRALAAAELPEPVAAVLAAEMALLRMPEAAVADAGAILGAFTMNGVAHVTGLQPDVVCHAVGELHRRDLIRTIARSPTYLFAFRHRVLADVRYSTIDPCERRRGHLRAFQYYVDCDTDGPAADRHVELALALPEPETSHAVLETARRVVRGNPTAAARWLAAAARSILAAGGPVADLVAVVELRARALAAAGQYERSREVLEELLRHPAVRTTPVRLPAVSAAAMRDAFLGLPAGVREVTPAGTASTETVELLVAQGLADLMNTRSPNQQLLDLALVAAQRHRAPLSEAGALALRALGAAHVGDIDATRRNVVAAARLIDGFDDDVMTRSPEYLAILGWAEALLCWLHPADRHLRRGLELARRTGRVHTVPLLLVALSDVRRQVGRGEEARMLAAEAVAQARRMRAGNVLGIALATESLSAISPAPDDNEALLLAEQAIVELRTGHVWSRNATVALALAAGADGDLERCRVLILEAGGGPDLARLPPHLHAWCFEMLALIAIDHGVDARPWARHATGAAETFPTPGQLGASLLAQAHVQRAAGASRAAVAQYLRAASAFATAGMISAQGRALLLGAVAAAEAGVVHLVSVCVGRGHALALQAGECRQVEEPDPGTGTVRVRRAHDGALATLTNREHEVAYIAGEGATTREIAKRLNLSPRTVDVHLSRIYRKLHLRSRTELARFIAAVNQSNTNVVVPAAPPHAS